MAHHANIKGFFDNMRARVMSRAEENLKQALPMLADMMHDYALEELKRNKKASMTGNFINSFGIALYKDGKFIAVATTHDFEGQSPIRVTLAKGDTFKEGEIRYDGRQQFHSFSAPTGEHRIYANEEVLGWLRRYPPSKKKGFSFRAISVVDYSENVGGRQVLLRIADDIENYGGIITQFNLG